jgi:hypothetical protein
MSIRTMIAAALLAVSASACFVPPPPWRGREFREERRERWDHDGDWDRHDDRYDRRERRRDDRNERRERWRWR